MNESIASTPTAESQNQRRDRARRDLRRIAQDGVFFGWMVGIGETYISAFALALGAGPVSTGFLATAPLLAGACLQTISPFGVRKLGTLRRWVVLCVCLQAATFVPLVVGALRGQLPLAVLFACTALYWAAGMGANPAWNTWVGTLVPRSVRHRYFARRGLFHQSAILLALMTGGTLLHWGASRGTPVEFFAWLFAAAIVARAVSARLLATYSDPPRGWPKLRNISPREFVRRLTTRHEGRLLLFLLLTQSTVMIASPFFTPYMLKSLQLDYGQYMTLLAASFVAKIVMLPRFGRLAKRWGVTRVLALGSLGIAPLPALWLVSDSFYYLLAVQLLSGSVWAAYELAVILLQLELIGEEERTSVLSYFNLANAMAQVTGTLLGGALLSRLGATAHAYAVLFAVSATARVLALGALHGLRGVDVPAGEVVLRVLAIRPFGTFARPIHASFRRARGSDEDA
ncbi:MAG TPA: MFS transporter [Candidatus Krumholzibacteria bacterium]|nr:MFS transporter [Candidatus Krumholzibacteria bacterium]